MAFSTQGSVPMYTAFFGLREKPFALSPDPRYLFLSEAHREALAHLLYGIEQGEGFIAVTGEVGTGKTTLCRTLLKRLGPTTEVAYVLNPTLSPVELLQEVNGELGLPVAGRSQRELHEQINDFVLARRRERRRVLLIIDEAQDLARETLEQVRLLSNLETDTQKLLQIILIGQPELDVMLESPGLRQLRQRITVHWRLRPLSAAETREYVNHRLQVAAGADCALFSAAALREIHRRSEGIPRLTNVLCERALLAAYADQLAEVDRTLVRRAWRELRGEGEGRRARLFARGAR
jgi:general secretion pathway protein A